MDAHGSQVYFPNNIFFPFQCNSSIVECSDQFIYMTFRFGHLGVLRASYAHWKRLGIKSGFGVWLKGEVGTNIGTILFLWGNKLSKETCWERTAVGLQVSSNPLQQATASVPWTACSSSFLLSRDNGSFHCNHTPCPWPFPICLLEIRDLNAEVLDVFS